MDVLIITPFAGAVIGYVTNWIAIRMLFRPHTAKYVFGIQLPFTPGLMPKERHRLSRKLGETLARHLITTDILGTYMSSDENMLVIKNGLQEFLRNAKEPTARMAAEKIKSMYSRMGEEEGGILAWMPKNTIAVTENLIYESMPRISDFFRNTPPDMRLKMVEFTGNVIDEAVGKLAGMFISSEKVYEGIVKGLCEYLDDEKNRMDAAKKLGAVLADFLENGARPGRMPWDTSAVESTLENLAVRLIDYLFDRTVPELLNSDTLKFGLTQAIRSALSNIDIGKIAEEQMNAMDISEAEQIIVSVVKRELQAITAVGGVLGFIIGLLPGLLSIL